MSVKPSFTTWLRRRGKLRTPRQGILRQVLAPAVSAMPMSTTTAAPPPQAQIEAPATTPSSTDPDNASIIPDSTPPTLTTPPPTKMETPPPPIPTPVVKITLQERDPLQGMPAASHSQKESIFLKLNKRLAALEVNMTLSTEYLSELSRRYVAQTDEYMKQLDKAVHSSEVVSGAVREFNITLAMHTSQV